MNGLKKCGIRIQRNVIKTYKVLSFANTGMGLDDIMLREVSQTQKEKHCITSPTCGILKS